MSRGLIGCLLLAGLAQVAACKSSTRSAPRTAASPLAGAAVASPTVTATAPVIATSAPTPRPGSTAAATPRTTVVSRIGEPGLFTITATGVVPDSVTVQAGRPVSFQNNDTVRHRLVSNEPGLFDTGDVAPGARATVQVSAPGSHDWHDTANPRLHGTVRVLQ